MNPIVRDRLANQFLAKPRAGTAAALVAWFGAVQAQEYEHARWGIGQRLAGGPGAAAIEEEMASGQILRTHVLRPTWHFVAAADLRWMQALTAPRVHARMATYDKRLELDAKTMTRALTVIERVLGDEGCLTRAEIGDALRQARIPVTPIRLAHIAMHAELECLVCSGPRRGRVQTYAPVASRAPRSLPKERDDALGELARRFFQSHGPATIRDFVWWSGLTTPDAKRGADIARLSTVHAAGRAYHHIETARRRRATGSVPVHLLPIYDEYLVAYRDRDIVPHGTVTIRKNGRAVGFQHAIVIAGQVAGTWRTDTGGAEPRLIPVKRLTHAERSAVEQARERYSRFVRS